MIFEEKGATTPSDYVPTRTQFLMVLRDHFAILYPQGKKM